MITFAAQYLESPISNATPGIVRERLHRAFDILPLKVILLGWNLPASLEDAIALECTDQKAKLYRWHPLFTGDAATPAIMKTVNRHGQPIRGFQDMPEFTFLCPNRQDVQEFIFEQIENIIQRGIFHGLFLDRVRFPSPTAAPDENLACFCEYCQRAAISFGLDLQRVQLQIEEILSRPRGRLNLVRSLFANRIPGNPLEEFLEFRGNSITRVVEFISKYLRTSGLDTALDCFSPSLAHLVGQDLAALDQLSVWTKIMTYPRTYGPAGLPFELLNLVDWLDIEEQGKGLSALREISELEIPNTRYQLAQIGLPASVISKEIVLARKIGVRKLLVGLALVQLPGVNSINSYQTQADLLAARAADGLVLSWDLWHISDEVLRIVNQIYCR